MTASTRGPRAAAERAAAVVRDRWHEDDLVVLDLVRLLVRAGSLGHAGIDLALEDDALAVLLDLDEGERPPSDRDGRLAALRASSAVAVGPVPDLPRPGAPVRPLVLTGDLLQTERAHRFEQRIVAALRRRGARAATRWTRDVTTPALALLDRLDAVLDGDRPPAAPDGSHWVSAEQRAAIRRLLSAGTDRRLAILSGGPGTGKTTTVATVLGLLAAVEPLRITLAAPTGRARSRLVESIRDQGATLARTLGLVVDADRAERVRADVLAVRAHTVHGLLGIGRDGVARRPPGGLPYDVVVVDESSMLDLPLAADLLDAVADDALVVLVGDPDQLESVGTGSVLHSLISGLGGSGSPVIGELRTNQRARSAPTPEGRLEAERRDGIVAAMRDRRVDRMLELLRSPAAATPAAIEWCEVEDGEDPAGQRDVIVAPLLADLRRARDLVTGADGPTPEALRDALDAVGRVRLLCGHRLGRWGVATWDRIVRAAVDAAGDAADVSHERREGEPVIMTVNDPMTRLSNGDVGVVASRTPTVVAFLRPPAPEGDGGDADGGGAGGLLLQPAIALPGIRSAHAITVHRAQGSEYDRVVVVMPPSTSRLATRELLYTAVTRARRQVLLVASEAALMTAVRHSSRRMGDLERAVADLVRGGASDAIATAPPAPDAG